MDAGRASSRGRGPRRAPHAPPASTAPLRDAREVRAELDEPTLVVRAQEGDVHAFEELARRHQDALFRVAVRITGDRSDAEDALQEALIDGWRRIGTFRAEAAFSTWMYRIVTHRCTRQLRTNRDTVPVADVGDQRAGDGSPERAAEVDAEMEALGRAVAGLPEEQRTSWVLREMEGLGYAEIAEITGAGETAVRGRIHRARTALAEMMRAWR
ncbi:RNA polymerase sigma-70 factor (ECF subfamily) [Pseudonocardia endophytica]|uniref:RNA polymerase sigma-70 factor (ECF subfamily) n=2 Tax=Pseudonocardia endophytica TaxID=401976 RepID=A0A4R1HJ63_PSEEN|nr:RNA polymerase sigma-70 factor (ECF subfamily) [Pseudonocardia endophytica]